VFPAAGIPAVADLSERSHARRTTRRATEFFRTMPGAASIGRVFGSLCKASLVELS
jgi:hypothetical protein